MQFLLSSLTCVMTMFEVFPYPCNDSACCLSLPVLWQCLMSSLTCVTVNVFPYLCYNSACSPYLCYGSTCYLHLPVLRQCLMSSLTSVNAVLEVFLYLCYGNAWCPYLCYGSAWCSGSCPAHSACSRRPHHDTPDTPPGGMWRPYSPHRQPGTPRCLV